MHGHRTYLLAGIGIGVLVSALIGLGLGGRTQAQADFASLGFKVILDELQDLKTHGVPVQLRRYYLTKNASFDGASALTACAVGFHMANLFEIFDPTTLQYDSNLGFSQLPPALSDIGSGPPNRSGPGGPGNGWIRTGNVSGNRVTAGALDCNAYTSNSSGGSGTIVALNDNWGEASQAVSPWRATTGGCNSQLRVWCVEDR